MWRYATVRRVALCAILSSSMSHKRERSRQPPRVRESSGKDRCFRFHRHRRIIRRCGVRSVVVSESILPLDNFFIIFSVTFYFKCEQIFQRARAKQHWWRRCCWECRVGNLSSRAYIRRVHFPSSQAHTAHNNTVLVVYAR